MYYFSCGCKFIFIFLSQILFFFLTSQVYSSISWDTLCLLQSCFCESRVFWKHPINQNLFVVTLLPLNIWCILFLSCCLFPLVSWNRRKVHSQEYRNSCSLPLAQHILVPCPEVNWRCQTAPVCISLERRTAAAALVTNVSLNGRHWAVAAGKAACSLARHL